MPETSTEQSNILVRLVQNLTYPLLLILSSLVVLYYRLQLQLMRGLTFDPVAFLAQGLTMAGKSTYFEVARPPVLPFLLSLFFRAGIFDERLIYYVDATFLVIGVIGLYYLLRLRFSRTLSFLGALIFISFPDLILIATFGFTDIMAVSLSIWTMYVLILAVEKDTRLYWLALPLLVVTFLTRFTAGLMLFPFAFYILVRGKTLADFKDISKGLAAAAGLIVIDIIYYVRIAGSDASTQFLAPFAVASQAPGEFAEAVTSRLFFLTNLPKLLSLSGVRTLLLFLLVTGLSALMISLFSLRSKDSPLLPSILVTATGVAAISYLIFIRLNFLMIGFLLVVLFLVVAKMFSSSEKNISIDLTMFLWLLVFLVFHSQLPVKTSRYFITMIPGIAFFVVYGFDFVNHLAKRAIRWRTIRLGLAIVVALTFVALIGLSAYASSINAYAFKTWRIEGVKESALWLKDKTKKDDVIYADYWVAAAWYLSRDIKAMPTFEGDPRAFAQELEKNNADYYLSLGKRNLPSYTLIKTIGEVVIYKKGLSLPDKPRVLLIGRGIDHYIEGELDFQLYVIRKKSPFPDISSYHSVSTTFVDGYEIHELKKYPILLLYDFRWHNAEAAQKLLKEYLDSGGIITMDASGNTGSASYDLRNKTFLDTNILPSVLPRHARPTIKKSSLATGVQADSFASFVSETGEEWGGTAYEASIGSKKLTNLVTINGNSLIATKRVGKGRIIFIGYNFFFHAFRYKNTSEQKLIRNLFDAALRKEL